MDSSRLVELLGRSGVSREAGRKRLERARAPVEQIPNLRLPAGARFWYLDKQFQTEEYWRGLIASLESTGSAYGVALDALDAHGGLVPFAQLRTICGSPDRGHGHLLAAQVWATLEALGLVEEWEDPELDRCFRLTGQSGFVVQETRERRATLLAERVLLEALKEWTRKLSLVSYDAVRIRGDDEAPAFGAYGFDYSAPSYVHPLRHGERPGFVVADVVFRDGVTEKHCEYFLRKCNSLRSMEKIHPFLAFLIAPRFEGEAFRKGRSSGFLFATTGNLFGEGVEKALNELVRLVRETVATATGEPERILKVFESMRAFEGAMQRLRGPMFELIAGHCLARAEEGRVEIDRDVVDPKTGQPANIDILHSRGRTAVAAYECKGRLSAASVLVEEVHDWLTRQVPRIYGWLRSQPEVRELPITFAFWTTGMFSPDALAFLEERRRETKRYAIDWKDGRAVREYARKHQLRAMANLLDEFYQSPP